MDIGKRRNLLLIPFFAKTDVFRLYGTWHIYDDCAISSLNQRSKISISLKKISCIKGIFKKNNNSGIISININGVEFGSHDLYQSTWETLEIDIFESDKLTDVKIEIEVIDKNNLSNGFQISFVGLLIGYGDKSKGEFAWLSDETKKSLFQYTGKNEVLYRNHIRKYSDYTTFFSKLNRQYMSLNGRSVLEVGCGIGMSTVVLRQMGAKVTAGDYDDGTTLKIAISISRDFRVDDSFRKIDVRNLEFDDETFDYVHCEQVLEHIPKKYHKKALTELCRVVKKDGLLYIDTENKLYPFDRHDSNLYFVHWLPKKIGVRIVKKLDRGIKIDELSFDNQNPVLHDYMTYFGILKSARRYGFSIAGNCIPYNDIRDFISGQGIKDLWIKILGKKSICFLPIHFLLKRGSCLEEKPGCNYIEQITNEDVNSMPLDIRNNKIDTVEIMNKIKDNVRRKKELGIYSDADIQGISNHSLEIPSSTGNTLTDHIVFLQRNYDFKTNYNISSHRPFLGKLIVPVKKFFLRAILKLESPILDKNVSYNFHLVQTLNSLVEEVESLKKECAELKQQSKSSKRA